MKDLRGYEREADLEDNRKTPAYKIEALCWAIVGVVITIALAALASWLRFPWF